MGCSDPRPRSFQYPRDNAETIGITLPPSFNDTHDRFPRGATFPNRYLDVLDVVFDFVVRKIQKQVEKRTRKDGGGEVVSKSARANEDEDDPFHGLSLGWIQFFCSYGGKYNCLHRFCKASFFSLFSGGRPKITEASLER